VLRLGDDAGFVEIPFSEQLFSVGPAATRTGTSPWCGCTTAASSRRPP
jgi:hypothetical protein